MGGKASIILVIGFAVIFGYINTNVTRLSTGVIESMVGYNIVALSRNMAQAGTNAALAKLTYQLYPLDNRVLSSGTFTDGIFAGCSYIARVDSIPFPRPHIKVTCESRCTTYLFDDAARTKPYVIVDSVIVMLDYARNYSFASFGWMSQQEGNVFFDTGDTLWGKVHSNDNIHISGRPVFHGRTTTSHLFNPKKNKAKFLAGSDQGVPEIPFPSDLSQLKANSTVAPSCTTSVLYVELKPGSSGTNNDGYAIISTGNFMGMTGAVKVDSIALSDNSDNVIYSEADVHVKGVLDGRLSVASNDDVFIEGNTTYENYPDAYHDDPGILKHPPVFDIPQNQTLDMLGLVARDDVIIPTGKGDITIHSAIFAKDGSFTAEDWNVNHPEGRINLIGSICQNTRGPVGQTNGNGYRKSYRFDPRFDERLATDPQMHPPSYPSYSVPSGVTFVNWWEKPSKPLIAKDKF